MIVLLDCYPLHLSEKFRELFPSHIHLVYVPPNCTSKLQLADGALNFPFKHEFKRLFNQWAAEQIDQQITNRYEGLATIASYCLSMSNT